MHQQFSTDLCMYSQVSKVLQLINHEDSPWPFILLFDSVTYKESFISIQNLSPWHCFFHSEHTVLFIQHKPNEGIMCFFYSCYLHYQTQIFQQKFLLVDGTCILSEDCDCITSTRCMRGEQAWRIKKIGASMLDMFMTLVNVSNEDVWNSENPIHVVPPKSQHQLTL